MTDQDQAKDKDKSRAELLEALKDLRHRVKELEVIEAKYSQLRESVRPLGMLTENSQSPEIKGAAESTMPGTTVLVVDDNDVFREFIVNALTNYGYRVMAAGGSMEALDLLAASTEPVALIIADVVMPDVSGSELVKKVKTTHPDVKVLFMSGYTDEVLVHSDVMEVLESKVAFLQKPFLIEDLLEMMGRELGESDS